MVSGNEKYINSYTNPVTGVLVKDMEFSNINPSTQEHISLKFFK